MELEFYQITSVGNRTVNQDCMANRVQPDFALFMVADGLGGHHAGEKASQYFCRGMFLLLEKFQPLLKNNPEQVFSQWVEEAVVEMRHLFADDPYAHDAHTTCAILYLDERMTISAHCGDSRIYRINPRHVLWRTRDHSLPQQLLEEGLVSEKEMGLHPEQNQLTRSINILNKHKAEIRVYPPLGVDETFVLCTDGFWEYLKEVELLQLAKKSAGKAELKKLAQLMVFRAGGKSDNVTVQLVRGV